MRRNNWSIFEKTFLGKSLKEPLEQFWKKYLYEYQKGFPKDFLKKPSEDFPEESLEESPKKYEEIPGEISECILSENFQIFHDFLKNPWSIFIENA